jgi:hypothetical protein
VFRGVPEQPEPSWLRDRNAHVPERLTGRSQLAAGLPSDWREGATLVSTLVYDPASQQIDFEPRFPRQVTDEPTAEDDTNNDSSSAGIGLEVRPHTGANSNCAPKRHQP